ncbi:AidA/PixA family protein [Photorhabdus australis]|uniref:AidA/PixA family protein n=1 Tax=Photorhabdus australis TaxID=286156 RepID=UPI00056D81D0|nr:AidA/PixA family protein [Photorhabdus australis]
MNNIEHTLLSDSSIQIIDVLVSVDAQTIEDDINKGILRLSHIEKSPTAISNKYFYYTTSQNQLYAPKNNATGELEITGKVGDLVRWRASSLSTQFDYQVFLYHMTGSGVNSYVSLPTLLETSFKIAVPEQKGTGLPNHIYPVTFKQRNVYCQQSTLLSPGRAQYTWYISIYNRWNNLIGYCTHDPFINII